MSILIPHFAASIILLTVLVIAILKIGTSMGDCPITGPAAKPGSRVIAIAYGACGLGGVTLASVLPLAAGEEPLMGLLLALGLTALGLGIGFNMAMIGLRDLTDKAKLLAAPAAPA